MNIKFNYLYRDTANNKKTGSVIFLNSKKYHIIWIEKRIVEYLIDKMYFFGDKLKVPNIRFAPYVPDLDHDWYEFVDIHLSDDHPDDEYERNIDEFLVDLKRFQKYTPDSFGY